MSERTSSACSRRGFLRAGTGAVGATAIAAASGTALAQDAPYDGYLSDADNFDGTTVDATGQDRVTVAVGAQGNGGGFAFAPPAVQVDPGTTVVWEWTGEGGSHNVVDENGGFESELTQEEGFTFEQTFDEEGVVKYFCQPHKGLGMKGVVAVGDTAQGEVVSGGDGGDGEASGGNGDAGGQSGNGDGGGEGSGSEGGGGEDGEDDGGAGYGAGDGSAANELAAQTLLAMLVLGFLSPLIFLLFVRRKLQQRPGQV